LNKNRANSHSIREIFRQKLGNLDNDKFAHDLIRDSLRE